MTQPSSSTVEYSPGSFEAGLENGKSLLGEHPTVALNQAQTLLRLGPDARAFRLAAEAFRKLGRREEAERAELDAIEASLSAPQLRQAALANHEGDVGRALELARQFMASEPDDALAMTIAAEALARSWDLESAESLLRTVLKRAPHFLRASLLLANCLRTQIRMGEAIDVMEEVVHRKPDNIQAISRLAELRAEILDIADAAELNERLVALDPVTANHRSNLAHLYRIMGRADDAIAEFRRALSISPKSGAAWWSLANYFPRELRASDQQAIEESLNDPAIELNDGALLLASGLLEDRKENHAAAFDLFVAGKKVRLAHQPYDPAPISQAVDEVIEMFTPQFYERRQASGFRDTSPIFIVGMPRSGTTMVERILGLHSRIEGTGELQIASRLAEVMRRTIDDPQHYAELLSGISEDQLGWVGKRYVEGSRDYRKTDKPRFIDKANLNWMQVGLLLLALPEAKIIDVRRNGVDCCWANFKMLFSGHYPAANDLRHVGRFYRDYVRLIDAVGASARGRILPVRYEDVVADIEGETRRIIDFIGVGFEPQCVDFHLATDAVTTASSEQVRRPLNRQGIGSSDKYRPWLGPLLDELGPLADA